MIGQITCTRRLCFEAGHRIVGHESKCAHLHGHSYKVLITATAGGLDDIGRIIDFGVIKRRIGSWIDREWDHGFLLWDRDHAAWHLLRHLKADTSGVPVAQKIYRMPVNPTAENIADYLLREICPREMAEPRIRVIRVTVEETENCRATAALTNQEIESGRIEKICVE